MRDAVCAFANDLPNRKLPGVAFVGIDDSGNPSGLEITDALLRQLADIKTDGAILPLPTMIVEKRRLRGAEVAVVTVQPALAPPVRHKGRIMIRIGPRRGIASTQDERILNEKRLHGTQPYDLWPVPGASLDDLDTPRFQLDYLPRAVDPEVLAKNDRTLEQKLAACHMVMLADEPVPSVLGVLMLGKDPRALIPGSAIQFLRVQGNELSDPIQHQELIEGRISRMVERIDLVFQAFNRVAAEFAGLPTEVRRADYPPETFQQIVRNALLHRAYEGTHAPVRVTWFDDRIEITSPGGPFGAVTQENFEDGALTDYRNPGLAEAMRVMGLVQRFGAGIVLAKRAMKANGSSPIEFRVEPSYIRATLYKKPG